MFLVLSFSVIGCSGELPEATQEAVKDADHFELLTLLPVFSLEEGEFPEDELERFHDGLVLGRVVIEDQATRDKLIDALREATRTGGVPADCFNPRHGIRIEFGERVHDIEICFECSQAYAHENGSSTLFYISPEQAAIFNSVAVELGLSLNYTDPDEPME